MDETYNSNENVNFEDDDVMPPAEEAPHNVEHLQMKANLIKKVNNI